MATEDYEILPHQLLQDLKSEVEALKKKLLNPDAKANELILEIESLKDSIHELTTLFQKALEQTKDDDVIRSVAVLKEKMETVVRQNETIAKGMIAISDKLEDWMRKNVGGVSAPGAMVQHTMGSPTMPGLRMAPPPQMEPPSFAAPSFGPMATDFPPPPPAPGKKRVGLFK